MSRRETVRDWIAVALDTIQTSGGYRTDPIIHKHFTYPTAGEQTHICVIMDNESWVARDDNMTDFDSEIKVVVLGRFNAAVSFSGKEPVSGAESDGEALLQDMKKVVYGLMLAEINSSSNRRYIMGAKGVQCFGPTYYPGNQGEVRIEFFVKIYSQDGDM